MRKQRMRIVSAIIVVAVMASCSASQRQYNENVKGIISYELNEQLYRLTRDHLICFKCETGSEPISVVDLRTFRPTLEACKAIFKDQDFDFTDQQVNSFKITTKRWEDRTSYVFTSEGLSFEESGKTTAPISQIMTVYDSDAACPNSEAAQ